ncbi:HAD family hydrolase [Halomonas heilongjiangensis]|uniref:Haloacid dehalogenase n=1 Tax=Halomonas heilongjiangensis TaxID=1387883 RepID=A0A2N7TQ45_9GAMM|nr:HAD family hydrolase [Halomonas heilongjiangensis]PMR70228.1 haloacid dehalogenase [Halomonas heilongjiangensis]PXX92831.1 haloacid dehalogenase [Halomonas heilongjiangensis]
MTSARLQAITFDLDDTLWDNHGVMERTETGHYAWLDAALADWLERRGEAPAARFAERFPLSAYQARRLELARRYPLRRGDFSWLRERALAALLEAYGLPRSAACLWAARAMQRFMALRHEVSPHPEVEPMLEALGKRYRLASITNGNVDIRRLALHRHFPVAIAAGEMFAPKPDPRPFLAALARLDTVPSRALHVGDSWLEDALPARRLGMQVAWIAAADSGLPTGIHRLAHVRELPTLIEWLERR